MGRFSQQGRAIAITTPLGPDALLLDRITGTEAVSEPFRFRLDLLAEVGTQIDFDRVLGHAATVCLRPPNHSQRFVHGIISELSEGVRVIGPKGLASFIRYQAELVPEMWLLKLRVQSRVFQQQTVWQILETILKHDWQLKVTLRKTALRPRNYCVQYNESDFDFVSRLMEEEGLLYFFEHAEKEHQLVVADGAAGASELTPRDPIAYSEHPEHDHRCCRIHEWVKTQRVTTCKVSVHDYHFEKPESRLEAEETRLIPEQVTIGKATHLLNQQCRVDNVDLLETYEYPGGFSTRIDAVGPGGSDQSADLEELFDEASKTARLRREEIACRTLTARGAGNCAHFLPGFTFALAQHFETDASTTLKNLLTRVEHTASMEGAYTRSEGSPPVYENRFECLPEGLIYRPARRTPKPRIDGVQTAMVVGPAGQEIFLDKYGRVKVKFHWDRRAADQNSSCWVRVAQCWAGKTWGAFFWPRIGNEVVVAFEEGDPDRPLIVGSVYNERNRPPLILPENSMLGGIKSAIFAADPTTTYNALVFHDSPDTQYLEIFSQRNELHHNKSDKVEYVPKMTFRINGG